MQKHITATVYVVAEINEELKVLLHKHKKLGIWIGIGGHVEAHENPIEAAHREAQEEIKREIEILHNPEQLLQADYMIELPLPLGLFEFRIPAYGKDTEHRHIDFAYAATMKEPQGIIMEEKFGWFTVSELDALPVQIQVKRNVKAAMKLYASIFSR